MFILNGKTLPLDSPFVGLDGTQYPAQWLRLTTIEEKKAIGIEEVFDSNKPYDQQYYWGYDNEGNLIPKELDDEIETTENGNITKTGLKTLHIKKNKEITNSLLLSTDWYIIRKFDRGIDIPNNISEYRSTVISVSQQRESLISAVTSVDDLKKLYESSTTIIDGETITVPPQMPNWPLSMNL